MSTYGIILIDLVGIGLILLILNLVRTKKLHVSYAVVWCLAIISLIAVISIPPLLNFLPKAVGATFPASAISLLAFVFIFLVLIFFSVQLSLISSRQTALIQKLALEELLSKEVEKDGENNDDE